MIICLTQILKNLIKMNIKWTKMTQNDHYLNSTLTTLKKYSSIHNQNKLPDVILPNSPQIL